MRACHRRAREERNAVGTVSAGAENVGARGGEVGLHQVGGTEDRAARAGAGQPTPAVRIEEKVAGAESTLMTAARRQPLAERIARAAIDVERGQAVLLEEGLVALSWRVRQDHAAGAGGQDIAPLFNPAVDAAVADHDLTVEGASREGVRSRGPSLAAQAEFRRPRSAQGKAEVGGMDDPAQGTLVGQAVADHLRRRCVTAGQVRQTGTDTAIVGDVGDGQDPWHVARCAHRLVEGAAVACRHHRHDARRAQVQQRLPIRVGLAKARPGRRRRATAAADGIVDHVDLVDNGLLQGGDQGIAGAAAQVVRIIRIAPFADLVGDDAGPRGDAAAGKEDRRAQAEAVFETQR